MAVFFKLIVIIDGILPPSQLNLCASNLPSEWCHGTPAFSDDRLANNLLAETAEQCKLVSF